MNNIDVQWKQFEENIFVKQHFCDQLELNIINEMSDVFILTKKFDSNRTICSLNNINSESAYYHLCEYRKSI